ncbi:SOS response-associated peptidase [Nocardia sp. NPDC056064]|uniref:SOS response-associated peptidase n=1 Tax=Nocardia sp. NPDC056064 TaxID=3345701 RepID=UPI0035D988C9
MCGRYATTTNPARLAADLDAVDETGLDSAQPDAGVSYNVAPTTQVLTVVERHEHGEPDDDPRLRIRQMRWGLIPSWTKAAEPGVPAKGRPLFNARADKATTAPSFRDAAKHKRCLVPMDGWYEWLVESAPAEKGKAVKRPFYMSHADGSLLYMAGLWSVWRDREQPDSEPLLSCTILTTDAVGALAEIHDRMPLPMPREHWDAWLDPDHPAPAELLTAPTEAEVAAISARPVSTLVNNVRNNGPELLAAETGDGGGHPALF